MTIAELKKMVAENIHVDEKGEDDPAIFFYEKHLNNIILSEAEDDIDMNMPFNASKTTIENSIITERAYKDMYLRGSVFENVIIKSIDLSCLQLYKCNFYNCIFEDTNFLEHGCFNKCIFEGCIFKDCSFNNIYLLNNSFCFCYLNTCSFNDCDFKDSYFDESKMYNITLNNCKNIEFSDILEIKVNN